MPSKDQKYRSVSISEEDYLQFEEIRKELEQQWSEQIGKNLKVSMSEVIKTGMTFYKQRKNFVKEVDRDDQGRFTKS